MSHDNLTPSEREAFETLRAAAQALPVRLRVAIWSLDEVSLTHGRLIAYVATASLLGAITAVFCLRILFHV